MPLGMKIWEEKSRATGTRYIDAHSEKGLNVEVNFSGEIEGHGKLEGLNGRIVGTDNFWEDLSEEGIMTGTAHGALHFESGHMIPFKAVGLGKVIKNSPGLPASLVSLIQLINPPDEFSWLKNTPIVWEAIVNPRERTIEARAYVWD